MEINTERLIDTDMGLNFRVRFDSATESTMYSITADCLADLDPELRNEDRRSQFLENMDRIISIIEQRRASGDARTLITTADI